MLDRWLTNIGPNRDAHNERVKLIATALNAISIASLIGGVLAPLLDANRQKDIVAMLVGASLWALLAVAAFSVLHYIRVKD